MDQNDMNKVGEQLKSSNLILVGMPGSGKSTVGVVLAKTLGMKFLDTDLLIQEQDGRLLHKIIETEGMDRFLNIEQNSILTVDEKNHIIATGGSVIYSHAAMEHLKQRGQIIYLDVAYAEIVKRVNNITTRGVAMREGSTLLDIYNERSPLYEKYMDERIVCDGLSVEGVIKKIIELR